MTEIGFANSDNACFVLFLPQCPFCAKAFLNNSYLQSHITRRHTGGGSSNKDSSSVVSPDLGVGSDSGHNQLETEVSQIKERLLKQEAELQEERRALLSLKNKVRGHGSLCVKMGRRTAVGFGRAGLPYFFVVWTCMALYECMHIHMLISFW